MIVGAGDTITLDGSPSDFANLFDTGSGYDAVYGSDGLVRLNSAAAIIVGAGDTITLDGSPSDFANLFDTGSGYDAVYGSDGLVGLNSAAAEMTGSGDAATFVGTSALSVSGSNEVFEFGKALGLATISGFASSDTIHLSAADWASFAVLQNSGDITELSSGNAIIRLDATDQITLVGVQKSSLTAGQFVFA